MLAISSALVASSALAAGPNIIPSGHQMTSRFTIPPRNSIPGHKGTKIDPNVILEYTYPIIIGDPCTPPKIFNQFTEDSDGQSSQLAFQEQNNYGQLRMTQPMYACAEPPVYRAVYQKGDKINLLTITAVGPCTRDSEVYVATIDPETCEVKQEEKTFIRSETEFDEISQKMVEESFSRQTVVAFNRRRDFVYDHIKSVGGKLKRETTSGSWDKL